MGTLFGRRTGQPHSKIVGAGSPEFDRWAASSTGQSRSKSVNSSWSEAKLAACYSLQIRMRWPWAAGAFRRDPGERSGTIADPRTRPRQAADGQPGPDCTAGLQYLRAYSTISPAAPRRTMRAWEGPRRGRHLAGHVPETWGFWQLPEPGQSGMPRRPDQYDPKLGLPRFLGPGVVAQGIDPSQRSTRTFSTSAASKQAYQESPLASGLVLQPQF